VARFAELRAAERLAGCRNADRAGRFGNSFSFGDKLNGRSLSPGTYFLSPVALHLGCGSRHRIESWLLMAVLLPAGLVAVTPHRTLWRRSPRVTVSVRPLARLMALPPTSQR
jgi:hypothetical protein